MDTLAINVLCMGRDSGSEVTWPDTCKHTKQKPYKCESCRKWFVCKGDMTRHMRTHMCKISKNEAKGVTKKQNLNMIILSWYFISTFYGTSNILIIKIFCDKWHHCRNIHIFQFLYKNVTIVSKKIQDVQKWILFLLVL